MTLISKFDSHGFTRRVDSGRCSCRGILNWPTVVNKDRSRQMGVRAGTWLAASSHTSLNLLKRLSYFSIFLSTIHISTLSTASIDYFLLQQMNIPTYSSVFPNISYLMPPVFFTIDQSPVLEFFQLIYFRVVVVLLMDVFIERISHLITNCYSVSM